MYRAKSAVFTSAAELVKTLAPLEASTGFRNVYRDEAVMKELSYKAMPQKLDMRSVDKARIDDLGLKGSLHPVDWKSITQVFTTLEKSIGVTGRVSITIRYDEPAGEFSNDGWEYVYIINEYGKYYFGYSGGGTRVSLDREYAIEAYENMFKEMNLPVVLTNAGDHFTLRHATDHHLEVNDSMLGRNPATFVCEMPDMNTNGLIDRLRLFVEKQIFTKILDVDWWAGHSARYDKSLPNTEKVVQIYNTAIDSNLPALLYSMCPIVYLQNLPEVEAIQQLCSENNFVTARIGAINFGDVRALVSVRIGTEGYTVEVGTKDQSAISKLSAMLGIEMENN